MRKEEWGLATVGSLLLSFAFPPYFIQFLAVSALGSLGVLLKTLDEKDRQRLVEFEKDFRKGYTLEKKGRLEEARAVYEKLVQKYEKFAYIAENRIEWLDNRLMVRKSRRKMVRD